MGSEMCIRDRHIATPPPLDPLSLLIKLRFEPVVKSDKVLFEQTLLVNQVSVNMTASKSFSSNSLINELIFSTTERALAQAIFRLAELGSNLLLVKLLELELFCSQIEDIFKESNVVSVRKISA